MSSVSGVVSDDDIDVYQSSGEEWNADVEKKRTTRRTSQRLRKKPRISLDLSSDDEDDDSENEKVRARNKKKVTKVTKMMKSPAPANGSDDTSTTVKAAKKVSFQVGTKIPNKDFCTGGFVVLKKDVQIGDASKPPCLWRIDGKALLQKYEVVRDEDQNKTLHRSTSVYTGWSPLDKDLYSPVTVCVQWHTSQQMTVELDWETLKNATLDSD